VAFVTKEHREHRKHREDGMRIPVVPMCSVFSLMRTRLRGAARPFKHACST
jgi:hypothetical protein